MTSPRPVAVVMPAFNEADGIGEFLTDVDGAFQEAGVSLIIGVVDDCSTDETGEVANRVGASLNCPVIVVANDQNRGHGPTSVRAWRLGLSFGAEIIVHVDGDGQFSGDDVVRTARAGEGVDGALGVRMTRADPWFRRVVTAALRTYIGTVIGKGIRDPNTPLRAYRAEALSELLDVMPPEPSIPSVYLSVAGATRAMDIVEIDVESFDRRGETAVGSTWGESGMPFLPTKRLMAFVLRAAQESIAALWKLRSDARQSL